MKIGILFCILLLVPSVWVSSAPIYGATVTADGPAGDGVLNSVLGAHNDTFLQIYNNTSITISFTSGMAALTDGGGAADLRIHTYDQPSPANAIIAVSKDGVNFTSLGTYSDANTNNVIDLNLDAWGFQYVVAVRITDLSGTSYGFDLDAIEGFQGGPIPASVPVPEPASLLLSFVGILFLFKSKRR